MTNFHPADIERAVERSHAREDAAEPRGFTESEGVTVYGDKAMQEHQPDATANGVHIADLIYNDGEERFFTRCGDDGKPLDWAAEDEVRENHLAQRELDQGNHAPNPRDGLIARYWRTYETESSTHYDHVWFDRTTGERVMQYDAADPANTKASHGARPDADYLAGRGHDISEMIRPEQAIRTDSELVATLDRSGDFADSGEDDYLDMDDPNPGVGGDWAAEAYAAGIKGSGLAAQAADLLVELYSAPYFDRTVGADARKMIQLYEVGHEVMYCSPGSGHPIGPLRITGMATPFHPQLLAEVAGEDYEPTLEVPDPGVQQRAVDRLGSVRNNLRCNRLFHLKMQAGQEFSNGPVSGHLLTWTVAQLDRVVSDIAHRAEQQEQRRAQALMAPMSDAGQAAARAGGSINSNPYAFGTQQREWMAWNTAYRVEQEVMRREHVAATRGEPQPKPTRQQLEARRLANRQARAETQPKKGKGGSK